MEVTRSSNEMNAGGEAKPRVRHEFQLSGWQARLINKILTETESQLFIFCGVGPGNKFPK